MTKRKTTSEPIYGRYRGGVTVTHRGPRCHIIDPPGHHDKMISSRQIHVDQEPDEMALIMMSHACFPLPSISTAIFLAKELRPHNWRPKDNGGPFSTVHQMQIRRHQLLVPLVHLRSSPYSPRTARTSCNDEPWAVYESDKSCKTYAERSSFSILAGHPGRLEVAVPVIIIVISSKGDETGRQQQIQLGAGERGEVVQRWTYPTTRYRAWRGLHAEIVVPEEHSC